MIVCNLWDVNISHAGSYSEANTICGGGPRRHPKKIKYVNKLANFDGITIFTDKLLHYVDNVKSTYKVAWLMEPKAYDPNAYNLIQKLENKFDFIYTHDFELLQRSKKYIFLPSDTTIIEDSSIKMHEKNKLCSFIYSNKKFLEGHILRHKVAESLKKSNFDVSSYGHGCNPIKLKSDALNDYMFSIAIENSHAKNYFTDKILDCFVTGTIPIYWGCSNVGNYFNLDGIISFNSIEDLNHILSSISIEKYQNMFDAAKENFELAKNYVRLDDIIADSFANLITNVNKNV